MGYVDLALLPVAAVGWVFCVGLTVILHRAGVLVVVCVVPGVGLFPAMPGGGAGLGDVELEGDGAELRFKEDPDDLACALALVFGAFLPTFALVQGSVSAGITAKIVVVMLAKSSAR